MTIIINETTDWQVLLNQELETVVDPMVLRCGELFLKGAGGANAPEEVWDLLTANLHAIGMFFDHLILKKKIPVFNYGDTFDATLNFDGRVLTRINDYGDEVLYDVEVGYKPYHQVKSAALAELKKLYQGPRKIQPKMAQEIVSELSTAEYKWSPSIEELELESETEKQLAAFFLGGLIFGGYAQQMESEHVLQPKRSRLFLATALQADSAGHKLEDGLFAELKAKANTPCEDLPWLPTFFPYLLDRVDTPMDILSEVVKLRRSGGVSDYRSWLQEVIDAWKTNGKISVQKKKDIQAVAKGLDWALGEVSSAPKIEFKATIADAVAMKPPGGIDLSPTLPRFWGWFLSSLPGKRYRKLLTRAVVADHEYLQLEKRVRSVWRAG